MAVRDPDFTQKLSPTIRDYDLPDKAFKQHKLTCLSKVDFSKKGSVDEPIVPLVQYINERDHYFTTSSCSGRICVFEENAARKKGCNWLFTSHETSEWQIVWQSIDNSTGDAFLKFEPFVLHVQCARLLDAQTLHAAAVASGFRNSGITVGKRGKIIAAVRSTHSLEVPLTHDGTLLVTEQYIRYIVDLANSKMNENLERIARFFNCLKEMLESSRISHSGHKETADNNRTTDKSRHSVATVSPVADLQEASCSSSDVDSCNFFEDIFSNSRLRLSPVADLQQASYSSNNVDLRDRHFL